VSRKRKKKTTPHIHNDAITELIIKPQPKRNPAVCQPPRPTTRPSCSSDPGNGEFEPQLLIPAGTQTTGSAGVSDAPHMLTESDNLVPSIATHSYPVTTAQPPLLSICSATQSPPTSTIATIPSHDPTPSLPTISPIPILNQTQSLAAPTPTRTCDNTYSSLTSADALQNYSFVTNLGTSKTVQQDTSVSEYLPD
jgi:hypothetical protein